MFRKPWFWVAFVLFAAAYLSETIRGGLLAIPADYIKVGSTQKVMLESLGNLGAMMQPMQQLMPAAAE